MTASDSDWLTTTSVPRARLLASTNLKGQAVTRPRPLRLRPRLLWPSTSLRATGPPLAVAAAPSPSKSSARSLRARPSLLAQTAGNGRRSDHSCISRSPANSICDSERRPYVTGPPLALHSPTRHGPGPKRVLTVAAASSPSESSARTQSPLARSSPPDNHVCATGPAARLHHPAHKGPAVTKPRPRCRRLRLPWPCTSPLATGPARNEP